VTACDHPRTCREVLTCWTLPVCYRPVLLCLDCGAVLFQTPPVQPDASNAEVVSGTREEKPS
jgi:hypothetical protein